MVMLWRHFIANIIIIYFSFVMDSSVTAYFSEFMLGVCVSVCVFVYENVCAISQRSSISLSCFAQHTGNDPEIKIERRRNSLHSSVRKIVLS